MKSAKTSPVLDRLVSSLSECLTPESARRLLALKADPELQKRVDEMASRHTEGQLSPEEEADYGRYVSYATHPKVSNSPTGFEMIAQLDDRFHGPPMTAQEVLDECKNPDSF